MTTTTSYDKVNAYNAIEESLDNADDFDLDAIFAAAFVYDGRGGFMWNPDMDDDAYWAIVQAAEKTTPVPADATVLPMGDMTVCPQCHEWALYTRPDGAIGCAKCGETPAEDEHGYSTLYGAAEDLTGIGDSESEFDQTGEYDDYEELCNKALEILYPNVIFDAPWNLNTWVAGNHMPNVTEKIDYAQVTESTPDELRALIASAAQVTS